MKFRLALAAFLTFAVATVSADIPLRPSHANLLLGPTAGGGGGSSIVLVQSSGTSPGACTSCVGTLTGTTSGNTLAIGYAYGGATSTQAQITGVISNQGTCSHVTGTSTVGGPAHDPQTDLWWCTNTASGTATITATVNNSGTSFMTVSIFELSGLASSPDAGIGNSTANGSCGGTCNSVTVTTNGNLPQNNDIILSIPQAYSAAPSPASGQTYVNQMGYLIGGTAGTTSTMAYTLLPSGAAVQVTESIGVLTHN